MPELITSFRVFLSSPGDVVEERHIVRKVADELNRDPLIRGAARFEIVSWDDPEGHIPLSASLTPQEAINRRFYRPSDCDVVIIILWSRMGAPLPDFRKPNGSPYLSAVEWEYEEAYAASPQPDILIFRRSEKPTVGVDDPNLEERLNQYRLVEQFFARFRSADGSIYGGYNTYDNASDFGQRLEQALRVLVVRRSEEIKRIEARPHPVVHQDFVSSARQSVFISYSHADEVWLERLRVHLAPLVRDGVIDFWDDTKIRPGSDWHEAIKIAIGRARVAVLLLSADFLASEFIVTDELPPLLAAAKEDGAVILPVIVSPCRFLKTPALARFQSVNLPSEPLIAMSRAQSEAMLVKVTDAIEEAIA